MIVGKRRAWVLALLACPLAGIGCDTNVLRPNNTAPKTAMAGPIGIEPTADSGPLKPSAAQQVLVHLDMARALESQGQADKAIAEYQRAIQKYKPSIARSGSTEERAKLHRRLAAAHDRLGRFDEAAAHYAEAQTLAPEEPRVWNDSGYSAYLQGNWDEAERLLRKAIQLDPSDPRAQTNLGLTLAAKGQTDAAYRMLTQAGSPASARANIAYVLAAQGKTEDARAYYQEVLEEDKENKMVRRALVALDKKPVHAPDIALTSHETKKDD